MRHAKYLFLDLETTGLDPEDHAILECAAVAVDSNLVALDQFSMVLHFDVSFRDAIEPVVLDMHDVNGLWSECRRSADGWPELLTAIFDMIARFLWDEGEPILAGSSIHFDRSFLREHLPSVVASLHHRMLDVSSLKMLRKDAGAPDMPKGDEPHRALPDALYSLEQARIIRNEMRDGAGWIG